MCEKCKKLLTSQRLWINQGSQDRAKSFAGPEVQNYSPAALILPAAQTILLLVCSLKLEGAKINHNLWDDTKKLVIFSKNGLKID